MLYQWEIGRRDVDAPPRRSSTLQWPDDDAAADELRDVRDRRWRATRSQRLDDDRSADRRDRRALAARADGGARSADPADGGLRAAARRRRRRRPVVINEALELARTFSTEEAVKFINGMLDAIRKKLERDRHRRVQCRDTVMTSARRTDRSNAAPTSTSWPALGVDDLSAHASSGSTRSRELVDAYGERTHDELEAERVRDDHERPHPRDPHLRQGELPRAVRRPREDPGLHPPGLAAASSTSRSSSCSTSATGSASKGGCSGPRPTS